MAHSGVSEKDGSHRPLEIFEDFVNIFLNYYDIIKIDAIFEKKSKYGPVSCLGLVGGGLIGPHPAGAIFPNGP
ncbi:MAG: hypothetical protein JSW39_27110 [Desulfobacterales bacterium]|nr:MAG: hypothetical protein JSW39_27110 [Desulfobacterales bacterium]